MTLNRFALATVLVMGMTQCVQAQFRPIRTAMAAVLPAQPPVVPASHTTHSPTTRKAAPAPAAQTRAPQYVANKGVVTTAANASNGQPVPGWTGSYGPGYTPGSYGLMGGTSGGPSPVVPVGPGVGGGMNGGMAGGSVDGGYADGGVGGGSCGCGTGCGTGCGGCGGCGCCQTGCPGGCGCRLFSWKSPGDMPQHMPYFPNAHGYYYFRPYNVVHVLQQQEMINRWGMDSRNPYDNRFFEPIYQQVEATLPPENVEPATAVLPPVVYR